MKKLKTNSAKVIIFAIVFSATIFFAISAITKLDTDKLNTSSSQFSTNSLESAPGEIADIAFHTDTKYWQVGKPVAVTVDLENNNYTPLVVATKIVYAPEYLDVLSVTTKTLWDDEYQIQKDIDNTEGTVRLQIAAGLEAKPTGSSAIATITFMPKAPTTDSQIALDPISYLIKMGTTTKQTLAATPLSIIIE